MNDAVIEKLVQKVINLLDDVNDVNILVRQLTPAQEKLNRINERIDAVTLGMVQIEDGQKNYTNAVKAAIESQKKSMIELGEMYNKIDRNLNILRQRVDEIEGIAKVRWEGWKGHLEGERKR